MFIRTDGSYGNLLSAIAWCLQGRTKPDGFIVGNDCPLLTDCQTVGTKENISSLIRIELKKIISQTGTDRIMSSAWLAWLSENKGIDIHLFEYFLTAFRTGKDPTDSINLPAAVAIAAAAKKSARLSHSYLGILRFRQSDISGKDFYIAEFEPDCNVLPLISGHFVDRFADQNFVIIDRRRQLAFLHSEDGSFALRKLAPEESCKNTSLITGASALQENYFSVDFEDEISAGSYAGDDISRYWKSYLKHLAIPERANNALQKGNLPFKHRKHMTEFL